MVTQNDLDIRTFYLWCRVQVKQVKANLSVGTLSIWYGFQKVPNAIWICRVCCWRYFNASGCLNRSPPQHIKHLLLFPTSPAENFSPSTSPTFYRWHRSPHMLFSHVFHSLLKQWLLWDHLDVLGSLLSPIGSDQPHRQCLPDYFSHHGEVFFCSYTFLAV